jgi:hypothetical protein
MIIHEVEQRSVEWMQLRAGILTASEMNQILTDELEPRTGEMVNTYMARKVAENWFGGVLPGFSNYNTDAGEIIEQEAIPWFAFEYGVEVKKVGFITTDDGKVGCSPDGLLEIGGIEVKSPQAQNHFKWLLKGKLPGEHAAQVHGSMWVTGATEWKFLSYHRRTPALVLTVERDDAIQARIREAVEMFLDKFDRAKARLIEINGGPPPSQTPRPTPAPTTQPTEPEYLDLIP